MKIPEYSSIEEKEKYFFHSRVNDLESFIGLIAPFIKDEDKFLFRGVDNWKYKMFSSLQRFAISSSNQESLDLRKPAMEILQSFKNNKFLMDELRKQLPVNTVITDYAIFAFIQHFGGFSPLIDFSSNISIALFFALSNKIKDFASIYIIPKSPYIFSEITKIYENGYYSALKLLEEHKAKYPEDNVDSSIIETEIKKMIFSPELRGVLVYGGNESQTHFGGSSFSISNINLWAQNGNFMQAPYNEEPLEEYLVEKIHCHHETWNYIKLNIRAWCIDISSAISNDIIEYFKVPTDKNDIYPPFKEKDPIEFEVKNIVPHI